jgi:hypothetical protein
MRMVAESALSDKRLGKIIVNGHYCAVSVLLFTLYRYECSCKRLAVMSGSSLCVSVLVGH